MKAAVLPEPGHVAVVDRPEPAAAGDIVKVRILVAPMCTEFKDRRAGVTTDTLGHEAAGVVVDPGDSRRVRPGQRVVVMPQYGCGICWLCTAGEHIYCPDQRDVLAETGSAYGTATYAEYVLKPDWLLLPVPADVDLRHAALACCGLGPAFNALHTTAVSATDTVLVSGCGPVGLGAVLNATTRGARVIALETNPYRAALARAVGAVEVLDPTGADPVARIRELTAGRGADCAVESSGARAAAGLLAAALRKRGRLATVAWGTEPALPPLVPLGLTVSGCWHWNHQRDATDMWAIIRRAAARLDAMVTHEFALDKVADAMDVQQSGACGKVFLLPFGTEALP
jgi:threonine dehydrogenase-like Zn-dependent dehydrogenase